MRVLTSIWPKFSTSPSPKRSPRGHRADFDALKARIEQLQGELAKLETEKSSFEATAAGHRVDFERERERSDKLMTDTMTIAAVAMSARAKTARLQGELSARRASILRACVLFRGVEVPAGTHRVMFRFAPFSFTNMRNAVKPLGECHHLQARL